MGSFGINLRKLRTANSLTQDQLAERLNVSKSRISMYENGNREPSFEMLETIADFFNVDMSTLIGTTAEALSAPEQELLGHYRALNDAGKDMLMAQARLYSGSEQFTKKVPEAVG